MYMVRFPSRRYQDIFGGNEEFLSINPDGSVYKDPVTISDTQWTIKEFPIAQGAPFQSGVRRSV